MATYISARGATALEEKHSCWGLGEGDLAYICLADPGEEELGGVLFNAVILHPGIPHFSTFC